MKLIEGVPKSKHPLYSVWYGSLDGQLWWDCYPGCRVFATREEAVKARMSKLGDRS